MGYLRPQTVLSKDWGTRRFFLASLEPPASFLTGAPGDSIYIGKTKLMHVPFSWSFKRLTNPHIAVIGITGSGKSYLVKTFLTRASLIWNTNALIIDWVGEYNNWVIQVGGKVVSLGEKESLNLLDLAGMKPQHRIKQIINSLEILTDLAEHPLQKTLTEQALERAYKNAGFVLSEREKDLETPTLKDVVTELEKEKTENFLGASKRDVEQALHRLRQFTAKGNDYFARPSSLKLEKITSAGLVCLDLHALPSDEMRSLAGLTLLQFLKEKMRDEGWSPDKGVKLFVVADEAWKIAKDERSDLITIVREGRKYQFGLIVASQNPTDINKTIFSNVGTVFVMRLQLEEFKRWVQGSLGYHDFVAKEIDRFGVGQAAVHLVYGERMDFPSIFVLERIDGEEPLLTIKIKGEEVELKFEKEEFCRKLVELGLKDNQIAEITSAFEAGDNELNVLELVSLLEKYGFARSVIIMFLRELGVKEATLARLFSKLQRLKLGVEADKLSTLVIKEEER